MKLRFRHWWFVARGYFGIEFLSFDKGPGYFSLTLLNFEIEVRWRAN